MPGNSEFRLTACINLPAVFSVQVPFASYLRLTPCNLSPGCNRQYPPLKIKNSPKIKEKKKKEKKSRKEHFGVRRNFYLSKILHAKHFIDSKKMSQISPITEAAC